MDHAPSRPFALRASFAVVLWGAAAVVLAIVVLGDGDPQGVADAVDAMAGIAGQLGLGALLAALAAILLWPPVVPGLRLLLRRLKDRMSVDQRPLVEAQARLAHFANAADFLTVGKTCLRMGDVKRALPALVRAVEIDPSSPGACAALGQAFFAAGDLKNAVGALGHAVELDESQGFGDALLLLGTALGRLARHDEAEAVLARHEARFGASRRADLVRANAARARGDGAAAMRFLDRAARPIETTGPVPIEERYARAKARVAKLRGGAPG